MVWTFVPRQGGLLLLLRLQCQALQRPFGGEQFLSRYVAGIIWWPLVGYCALPVGRSVRGFPSRTTQGLSGFSIQQVGGYCKCCFYPRIAVHLYVHPFSQLAL